MNKKIYSIVVLLICSAITSIAQNNCEFLSYNKKDKTSGKFYKSGKFGNTYNMVQVGNNGDNAYIGISFTSKNLKDFTDKQDSLTIVFDDKSVIVLTLPAVGDLDNKGSVDTKGWNGHFTKPVFRVYQLTKEDVKKLSTLLIASLNFHFAGKDDALTFDERKSTRIMKSYACILENL